MANDIFVDTSGFYAILAERDPHHAEAIAILDRARRSRGKFLTTDYVLDETATLLKSRKLRRLVGPWLDQLQTSSACHIAWMDSDRFAATARYFQKHDDKEWSFTDCFSFVQMRERKLKRALTTDHHFRQAGFEILLT